MNRRRFYIEFVIMIFILCRFSSSILINDDDDDDAPWNRCPWIRNKLKNGKVKIRNRGRIAKFLCDPGYELVGKRFATCVRGQWNNPIPVCVARGCSKLPEVPNGQLTEMYRGAVIMFDCLPGYSLEGPSTLYCDGRHWTSSGPTCVAAATDAQKSCDFEDPDLCGWTQDPNHEFDWKRHQFSTPSGHAGTGPTYDHTFGSGKGGFYLYQEASSPRKPNDMSRLFSPVYNTDQSGGCFLFWYHMYGSTIGGLKVYIKPESHVFGELPPSWELFGNQGESWIQGNVSVPKFSENFQIVIEGIRGSNYIGDTAIDDVYLFSSDCSEAVNSTENTYLPASNSCRGRCREAENSTYCGCNDDCQTNGNCCYDFITICTGSTEITENPPEENNFDTTETTSLTSESSVTFTREEFKESTTEYLSTSLNVNVPITNSTDISTDTSTLKIPTTTTSQTIVTTAQTFVPIVNPPSTSAVMYETNSTSVSSFATKTTTPMATVVTTVPMPTTIKLTSSTAKATTFVDNITPTTIKTTISTEKITPATIKTTQITTTTTTRSTPVIKQSSTTISTTNKATTPVITVTFPKSSAAFPSTTTSSSKTTTNVENLTLPFVNTPQSASYTTRTPITTAFALNTTLPEDSSTPFHFISLNLTSTSYSTAGISTNMVMSSPTAIASTTSTRKTYNLRPRNRTIPSTISLSRPFIYSSQSTKPSTKPTRSTYVRRETTPYTRTSFFSTTTKRSTTLKTSSSTFDSKLPPELVDKHASKSASTSADNGQNTVTVVSVIIVVIICLIGGGVYFKRRQSIKRRSKLSDDSEMRFLYENEVAEYSDPSALDKMLLH